MAGLAVGPRFAQVHEDHSDYDSDSQSRTTSITSKATNYPFVNGRRYHAHEEGRYVFPNDEEECERLDAAHQVVRLALGRKIFRAPVKEPNRVLDIGTGTGIWAMEVGDMFPRAEVLGNDLSPIQPRWVPPNVHFEVDDVEREWTYSRPFDFIHCRALYGAISDWPRLVRNCYENTAPGGYCEFTDWDLSLRSPDNTIAQDSRLKLLNDILIDELENGGSTASPGPFLLGWIKDAGYQIVDTRITPLPYGVWPRDNGHKEIGAWNLMQLFNGLESLFTYVLLVKKGWTEKELEAVCAIARAELESRGLHSMVVLYNVVGRKPE